MKKVTLNLSAVLMTAMMLSSCGGGASKEVAIGNQEDTIGNQEDTVGNQEDTIGYQEDTIGYQEDTIGNQEDTIGYQEVTIGNQVWMAENLNVDTFRNGDPIPEVKTIEEWKNAAENGEPAWCYYDNDPANGKKYGKLYNWNAVNDPRGLAPVGFHIPSYEEWRALADYLGRREFAGTKMKSDTGWQEAGNGTNSSRFSGLPGGYFYPYGTFRSIGFRGCWWSSTETEHFTYHAWSFYLRSNNGSVSMDDTPKNNGLSVRCLRD